MDALDSGELPLHTVRGTICALEMAGTNDRSSFRILTEDGSVTEPITREALPGRYEQYDIGKRVIWTYVNVRHRGVATSEGPSKQTVDIWVGETVTLFRPIGPDELALIVDANFAVFPPRLPEQPIFYPVCNFQYAAEIAAKWNANEGGSYVSQFEVDKSFLDNYEIHQVGDKTHLEYWIPAEELNSFSKHIVGKIEIIRSFLK